MLNYMKGEIYRNFNRIAYWNFVVIISVLTLIFNIIIRTSEAAKVMNMSSLIDIGIGSLLIPVFLVLIVVDLVTAEEQKNLTLKNTVAFGLPRNKVVFSKLLVTIILSLIAAIIILTVFYGSGALLLGIDNGVTTDVVKDFGLRLLASSSIWIGAISLGTFLAFLIKKNSVFAFIYAGLMISMRQIIQILITFVSDKFQYVYNILLTNQISILMKEIVTTKEFITAIYIGLAYLIVFTGLTMIYFSKKEIK